MKSIYTFSCLWLILVIQGFSINYLFAANIVEKFSHKNDFLKIDSTHYLPSPDFWITKGVEIVDGNVFCYNPHHSVDFKRDTFFFDSLPATISYKTWKKYTPVFRMNRVDTNGKEYNPGKRGGDYIVSQIIDIRNKFNSNISLSYERTGRMLPNTDCGWSDSIIYGPEHRVILNGDTANEYRRPDNLIVEIIGGRNPDSLVNISDKDWINYPRRNGAMPEIQNPAMTIFGGGGYRRAFLETDKDSVLTYNDGLRSDLYDDGKDTYFHKAYIVIPDTFVKMGYIRIRVRVDAEDNSTGQFNDDYDDFFVESLDLFIRDDDEEISIDNAFITNPYSIITRKQAIKIPFTVRISNNSSSVGVEFMTSTVIKNILDTGSYFDLNFMSSPYENTENFPYILPMTSFNYRLRSIDFSSFDQFSKLKLKNGENKFQVFSAIYDTSYVQLEETGLFKEESIFYSEFSIYFDSVLAYDNPVMKNDIPDFTGIPGTGIRLYGFAFGGDTWKENFDTSLSDGGSGQIAIKFTLVQPDTILGIQAYFGSFNKASEYTAIAIYSEDNNSSRPNQPYNVINGSLAYKTRGLDDISKKNIFDGYITYLFDKPVIINSGTYWATVSQLENTLSLGGSKYRMGLQAMNLDTSTRSFIPFGGNCRFLMLDKNYRKIDTSSKLINNNVFDFENTRGSGQWQQFIPDVGHPAYPHLNGIGNYSDIYNGSFSRGTFVPMIRVLMKKPGVTWMWKKIKIYQQII